MKTGLMACINTIEACCVDLQLAEINRDADRHGTMALLPSSLRVMEDQTRRRLDEATSWLLNADPPKNAGLCFAASIYLIQRAMLRHEEGKDGGFGLASQLSNREVLWSVARLLRECLPENSENPSAEKKENDSQMVNPTL